VLRFLLGTPAGVLNAVSPQQKQVLRSARHSPACRRIRIMKIKLVVLGALMVATLGLAGRFDIPRDGGYSYPSYRCVYSPAYGYGFSPGIMMAGPIGSRSGQVSNNFRQTPYPEPGMAIPQPPANVLNPPPGFGFASPPGPVFNPPAFPAFPTPSFPATGGFSPSFGRR
jgi:hypothetical protein